MSTSFNLMKNLNESTKPEIKQTKRLRKAMENITEGAGAGYYIIGTVENSHVNSFNVVETTEDEYGIPTYIIDCDIDATLKDVSFESYEYGGKVDSASIHITKLCLTDNHEPEEKGELNETNIQQSLNQAMIKSLIGGGYIHQKFEGEIEFDDNTTGSNYTDFYVEGVGYNFTDSDLINYIDLSVRGENITTEYIVYSEDYDMLADPFESEEEAIEYAKNNPEAYRVQESSYVYDFDGGVDINSEYSEIVWQRDDFEESEHIKESEKLEEKLNGNEIMVFSKKAIEAKSEEELKKIANEIKYYSEPTYTRCMEIINGDGSVQYKAGQISDIIFQLNESEEHDLSKDLLGDEANKRKSEDQRTLETYLQLANEIKDGKNDTITLDSAKELVKNAYIKAKGYLSFEPEEIDKRIAKDIPELFGELEESNLKESENKISYQDLVAAGESLWRDDATIYKTNVDGIWDCHTAGHGGYLVDATKFPELAKYGDKTSVDNIVGFEEDYEALKVIWVVPEVLSEKILSNNNFIKNLTIDQVTKYDNNDNFKNEFPDKKVKDNLDESEELIEEEIVSDKLTEVKSQGNVYMLQDNDKYIVGEDYNKEENLIENAEIYTSKEEADKDYFSRCDITRDGEQVNPTEQNLGVEEQPTEEA